MLLRKKLSACLMVVVLLSCQGQSQTEISDEQSLGQKASELDQNIWSIFQDNQGHYWFGSNRNGVYRYDGKELIQYTTEDGLASNTIRGAREDLNGNIYIETPEGISKFDGQVFKTLPVIKSQKDDWKLEPGDVWYNSNGNQQDLYRCSGDTLYELMLPRQDLINTFGEDFDPNLDVFSFNVYSAFGVDRDQEGNLWIGTCAAGAYRYDGETFTWFGEKELSILEDGRVPGVRSMIQDKDGYFWLSNIISKYRVNEDGSYEKLPGIDLSEQDVDIELPYFMSAVNDDNGNLWMSSYGDGVWKYDGVKLEQFELREGEKEVTLISIYKDREGDLWLTSDNSGVWKYAKGDFKKVSFEF